MAKASAKEILNKVKKKQQEEVKVNVTFRIKSDLLEKFRARCDNEGVSMTAVIEEFMNEFFK